MSKCEYFLKPKNDDGTYTAVCTKHDGVMFEYGDPQGIMYHLCPVGLELEGFNAPKDYTDFHKNQSHIKLIDGKCVWVD